MKVVIMAGCSGSGKSTYARKHYPNAEVFSADSFFMVKGEYCFDPSKLGDAHAACLKGFLTLLASLEKQLSWDGTVLVDNTNSTVAEIAPYAAAALAYGADLEIIALCVDSSIAAARNVHGCPEYAVVRQAQALVDTLKTLPPWWPVKVVEGNRT